MTGYTVHTGTSKKFVSGWDRVFSGKTSSQSDGGATKKGKNSAQKKKKK